MPPEVQWGMTLFETNHYRVSPSVRLRCSAGSQARQSAGASRADASASATGEVARSSGIGVFALAAASRVGQRMLR